MIEELNHPAQNASPVSGSKSRIYRKVDADTGELYFAELVLVREDGAGIKLSLYDDCSLDIAEEILRRWNGSPGSVHEIISVEKPFVGLPWVTFILLVGFVLGFVAGVQL